MINTSNVIKTLNNDYVFFFILGLFFTQFSQLCGMLSGKEAVLYYAEIHQDFIMKCYTELQCLLLLTIF